MSRDDSDPRFVADGQAFSSFFTVCEVLAGLAHRFQILDSKLGLCNLYRLTDRDNPIQRQTA